MRRTITRLVLAAAAVGLIAAPALAQTPAIRLFWTATNTYPPVESSPVVNTAGGPVTLYLWAEMINPGGVVAYNWMCYNIHVDGGGTIDAGVVYNPALPGVASCRWGVFWVDDGVTSPVLPSTDARNFSNMYGGALDPARGITNAYGTDDPCYCTDGIKEWSLVGEYLFSGVGDVFIGVGLGGIARATAGGPEPVYFGFGDEGDGLMGDSFDMHSSLPDARLVPIPEPASFMLTGFAVLMLRRR